MLRLHPTRVKHKLCKYNFFFFQQKQQENEKALSCLSQRLQHVDGFKWAKRQETLITAVLAGNMFDWGAREVADLMENPSFGFNEALGKIQGNDCSFFYQI